MPYQPLIPLLDAAMPVTRVSADEERRVRRLLRQAQPLGLPDEIPDFVIAVTGMETDALGRLRAEVMLFDGASATLEISGTAAPGGELAVRWHRGEGEIPFGFDRTLGIWRRFPEHAADAEIYGDAFARLAIEEAVAEKRREAARLAAEIRRRNRAAARVNA